MVVHTFNPHVQDAEAGRSLRIGGGSCLHDEFQVTQGLVLGRFHTETLPYKKKGLMGIYILEYQFSTKLYTPYMKYYAYV